MYACVVRREDGQMDFLLTGSDEKGQPVIPIEWTLVDAFLWHTVEATAVPSSRREGGGRTAWCAE